MPGRACAMAARVIARGDVGFEVISGVLEDQTIGWPDLYHMLMLVMQFMHFGRKTRVSPAEAPQILSSSTQLSIEAKNRI